MRTAQSVMASLTRSVMEWAASAIMAVLFASMPQTSFPAASATLTAPPTIVTLSSGWESQEKTFDEPLLCETSSTHHLCLKRPRTSPTLPAGETPPS